MRHDGLYLDDALQAIRALREFLRTVTEEEFLADPLKQSFVFHRLLIVGEATVCLRGTYQERYPAVPWAQIAGLRNRLVHAYFEVNLPRLWEIATGRLDTLESQFQEILDTEFPPENGECP